MDAQNFTDQALGIWDKVLMVIFKNGLHEFELVLGNSLNHKSTVLGVIKKASRLAWRRQLRESSEVAIEHVGK